MAIDACCIQRLRPCYGPTTASPTHVIPTVPSCLQPLETLTPLLMSPGFNSKEPMLLQLINKVSWHTLPALFIQPALV